MNYFILVFYFLLVFTKLKEENLPYNSKHVRVQNAVKLVISYAVRSAGTQLPTNRSVFIKDP